MACFCLLFFTRVAVEDELEAVAFLSILGQTIVNTLHTADCLFSFPLILVCMFMFFLFRREANLKHCVTSLLVLVVKAAIHVFRTTILLLFFVLWIIFCGLIVLRWLAAQQDFPVASSPCLNFFLISNRLSHLLKSRKNMVF